MKEATYTEEQRVALEEGLEAMSATIETVLGVKHDLVLLFHDATHGGDGKCPGTNMMSTLNPVHACVLLDVAANNARKALVGDFLESLTKPKH